MKQILAHKDELRHPSIISKVIGGTLIPLSVHHFIENEKLISVDGEINTDCEIFLFKILWPNPNEKLMELFLILDLLQSKGVSISIISPFIPYLRQDKFLCSSQTIGARAIGNILSQFGVQKIYSFDLHSQNASNFLKCTICDMNYNDYFIHKLALLLVNPTNTLVVAPDAGALNRAKKLALSFGSSFTNLQKHRHGSDIFTSPLRGAKKYDNIVIIDDIMDSGNTILSAINRLQEYCDRIFVCISHVLKQNTELQIINSYSNVTIIFPDIGTMSDHEIEMIYCNNL